MTIIGNRLKTLIGDPSYWFLMLIAVVLVAYSSTLSSMFSVWWEDGSAYSHGLLLSVIAIIIFVKNWYREKDSLVPGFHPLSFIFLLLCIPLWIASHLMFIQSAEQFFFLAILFFLMPTLLGVKPSLKYLFPIILLLVTVPVWGVVISVLQLSTTVVSVFFLKLSGIFTVRDGFLILVPAGTFEVEAACSGLRYQLAGLSLSLLYIYMSRLKIFASLLFLCCAVAVVFLANVTRIYIVVIIGDMTQMQSSLVEDHLWLGWIIFAIYIVLFLWLAEKIIPLKKTEVNQFRPEQPLHRKGRSSLNRQKIALVSVLVVCLSGPILASYFSLAQYRDVPVTVELKVPTGAWHELNDIDKLNPLGSRYQRANGQLSKIYTNPQGSLLSYDLYYYLYQEQGREAINELNQVYDDKRWKSLRHSFYETPLGRQGQVVKVKESVIRDRAGKNKLVWQWYYTNDKLVASDKQAKLENLYAIIKGKPAISVNIISTDIVQDAEHARGLLGHFVGLSIQAMKTTAMSHVAPESIPQSLSAFRTF